VIPGVNSAMMALCDRVPDRQTFREKKRIGRQLPL
jgi:hypothetical protein